MLGMKGAGDETDIWKIRLQLTKPVTWVPLIWGAVFPALSCASRCTAQLWHRSELLHTSSHVTGKWVNTPPSDQRHIYHTDHFSGNSEYCCDRCEPCPTVKLRLIRERTPGPATLLSHHMTTPPVLNTRTCLLTVTSMKTRPAPPHHSDCSAVQSRHVRPAWDRPRHGQHSWSTHSLQELLQECSSSVGAHHEQQLQRSRAPLVKYVDIPILLSALHGVILVSSQPKQFQTPGTQM